MPDQLNSTLTDREPIRLYGEGILDFLGTADTWADRAQSWTPAFWQHLQAHCEGLHSGQLSSEAIPALQEHGLVDEHGQVSEFGRRIAYHLVEQHWQGRGDPLRDVLIKRSGLDEDARILDVCCGAGNTLHFLGDLQPAVRVGIDFDLLVLVLGERMYGQDSGRPITLLRGSALELPLPDQSFTHVLSRVSISYLPQAAALREMVRVLTPGGYLALRFETLGYDFFHIRNATNLRARLGRSIGLLGGLFHHCFGIQPPLGRWVGLRQFASVYRLGRILRRLGCTVIHDEVVTRSPRCLGLASQKVLLARRDH